jgi:hypothetical protein
MRIVSIFMIGVATAAIGAAAAADNDAGSNTASEASATASEAAATATGTAATLKSGAGRAVSLVGPPLVMRLNSDEFRIAFGIDGKRCMPGGCSGSIHYRVHWKTADGSVWSDVRRVTYRVSPDSGRTIAVDRQYLDTAEGAHTTEVTDVSVERITCEEGSEGGGT